SSDLYTFTYLFLGGPAPPAPGPDVPGTDPTVDGLGCSTDLACGEAFSLTLSPGGRVEAAPGAVELAGAAVGAGEKTTVPAGPVTIRCAADIVPAGYVALGPAVQFGP